MKRVGIIWLVAAVIFAVAAVSAPRSKNALTDAKNSRVAPDFAQEGKSIPQTEVKPEGEKLPLKYSCLGEELVKDTTFTPMPSGQMLVGVCDTLYKLDSQKKIIWHYTVPQLLIDYAYVESTGMIYGTAGDNTMFILDAASGKELFYNSRNGSAGYGEVKAYGKDQCLIINNNWGYRDRLRDPTIRDGIMAWRGTEFLWSADFPPDASLVINGDKILAVAKSKAGVFVKEIAVPKN